MWQNALIKDKCNARTSLLDVAKCFSGIIKRQSDIMQHLRSVRMVKQAAIRFKRVLDACEYPIACWPRRFMEEEMAATVTYYQLGGGGVDGPCRAASLKRTLEYIEDKLFDATPVFGVHEERNSKSYVYLLCSDSQLFQCRTLQVLGLDCRYFRAVMIHNLRF